MVNLIKYTVMKEPSSDMVGHRFAFVLALVPILGSTIDFAAASTTSVVTRGDQTTVLS